MTNRGASDQLRNKPNANISRALAQLMPLSAINRSRIGGESLPNDLAEAVVHCVKCEWKLLDVENKASSTLALLRTRYVIETAEINP
jgi:hypothetical protein